MNLRITAFYFSVPHNYHFTRILISFLKFLFMLFSCLDVTQLPSTLVPESVSSQYQYSAFNLLCDHYAVCSIGCGHELSGTENRQKADIPVYNDEWTGPESGTARGAKGVTTGVCGSVGRAGPAAGMDNGSCALTTQVLSPCLTYQHYPGITQGTVHTSER